MSLAVKTKDRQVFKKRLYSLPLDVKKKIFSFAVISHYLDLGEKEHKKNFKQTKDFFNPVIYNPRTDTLTEEYKIYYEIIHSKKDSYGNKLELVHGSYTSCKDRRLGWSDNKNIYHLDNIEEIYLVSQFRLRPLCQRKSSLKTQSGIKDIKLDNILNQFPKLPKDLWSREWTNKSGYYWYHEKCRCRGCDRVRFIGHSYLSISDKEKFNNINWDNESKQWNPKSKNQLKYEKN